MLRSPTRVDKRCRNEFCHAPCQESFTATNYDQARAQLRQPRHWCSKVEFFNIRSVTHNSDATSNLADVPSTPQLARKRLAQEFSTITSNAESSTLLSDIWIKMVTTVIHQRTVLTTSTSLLTSCGKCQSCSIDDSLHKCKAWELTLKKTAVGRDQNQSSYVPVELSFRNKDHAERITHEIAAVNSACALSQMHIRLP